MAPQYKLTYFESRAVAEPIRLILAHKGIEFEDIRIPWDSWPEHKQNYPWGALPVLQDGEKTLAQSTTIQRYLAKKYNLTGVDDFEAAQADELVEAMVELRTSFFDALFAEESEKALALEAFRNETLPKYLKKYNERLEKNRTYLVGKTLTYADLNIASYLQIFNDNADGALDAYPLLMAHQKTVFNDQGIKEWLAKRPKTHI